MERKIPASCIIITKNEESKIRACLESVSFFEEIIVVDAFSTDKTIAIAKEYATKIYQREWVNTINQKQFALDQTKFDWVLNLDADEVLSVELQCKIVDLFEAKIDREISGFLIPRKNFFINKWLKYGGWYPDYKLRLFRKPFARLGGIPPHDIFTCIKGRVEKLKEPILHYTYSSISEQIQQIDNFSELSLASAQLPKFSILKLIFKPIWRFLSTYLFKLGFLDGIPGLIVAVNSAFYVFNKQAKIWERRRLIKPR